MLIKLIQGHIVTIITGTPDAAVRTMLLADTSLGSTLSIALANWFAAESSGFVVGSMVTRGGVTSNVGCR